MAIAISRRARDFIQHKGGAVTVRLSPRHGCCGGMASLAVADAAEPDDPACYRQLERDGIRVHIAPELVDEGLIIDLEGWGIFRHLYVDGAPLKG